MENYTQYGNYRKPSWAPPPWLFAPVWSILYVLIAISFGYVVILYARQLIPFLVLVPFILNLIFNFAFTPIQFGLKNYLLAVVDILLVLGTLIWALIAIYPYAHWVSYINLPYVAWVSFASVLQITVTLLNRK